MKHPFFKRTEQILAELKVIDKQINTTPTRALKEKREELIAELRIQPISVSL